MLMHITSHIQHKYNSISHNGRMVVAFNPWERLSISFSVLSPACGLSYHSFGNIGKETSRKMTACVDGYACTYDIRHLKHIQDSAHWIILHLRNYKCSSTLNKSFEISEIYFIQFLEALFEYWNDVFAVCHICTLVPWAELCWHIFI